jgi:hypothetical protein
MESDPAFHEFKSFMDALAPNMDSIGDNPTEEELAKVEDRCYDRSRQQLTTRHPPTQTGHPLHYSNGFNFDNLGRYSGRLWKKWWPAGATRRCYAFA